MFESAVCYARKAGLGKITPHDFRRTFAKLAHQGHATQSLSTAKVADVGCYDRRDQTATVSLEHVNHHVAVAEVGDQFHEGAVCEELSADQ